MRSLILGGTGFLGYHTTAAALAAGHDVTVFNRGKSRPDAFPGVTRLVGDRIAGDLEALRSIEEVDLVVDCTAYFPHQVRDAAAILRERARRYVLVSTVSVYDEPSGIADEDAPLASMPAGADPTQITGETYGPLKVACEEAARAAFGEDAIIVRPGLIVGPEDPTDRFTYWVRRGVVGGTILAPGTPDALVQVIDGRDLGAWLATLGSSDASGTFNAVAPPERFGDVLDACAVGPDAGLRWVPDDALLGAGVAPWTDLPLWLAGDDLLCTAERAFGEGLRTRSMAETIAETRTWDENRAAPLRAGITAEREAELLASL